MATKQLPNRNRLRERLAPAVAHCGKKSKAAALWPAALSVLLLFVATILSGCGASNAPGVSAISYPNGSPSGVAPGAVVALSATVLNDSKNLGVDWLATCTPLTSTTPVTSATSALCGTFAPTHTASGSITNFTAPFAIPTNGAITITATATSDPTRISSSALNISGEPIAVTITPSTATVEINQSTSLSAAVANDPANAGVIWTLSCNSGDTGPACGGFTPYVNGSTTSSIKALPGSPITYYAPSVIPTGSVTLIATSVTNPQISASVMVTVSPTILISFFSQPPAFLAYNASTNVTAVLQNDFGNGVIDWSATAGVFSTTTTTSGQANMYTAPMDNLAGQTVTITATSETDPTVTVSATITLGTTITVGISMAPLSLQTGTSANFVATVVNDPNNLGVMWTASEGSFSPSQTAPGVPTSYTAPAIVPNGATVTVTATSVADPTKFATSVVPIYSLPIQVTVTPATASVQIGSTTTFVATLVNDAANVGVKWTATAGTFNPVTTASGVSTTYTPPATLPSGGTVTVTATSVTDSSKSAMATVTVTTPPIRVSIVPAAATLQVAGSAGFTAVVSNDSANAGVTWTAAAGSFSPSQTYSGSSTIYTAPSTIPAGGTVVLTATSVSDPTKTATATVTVSTQAQPITVSVTQSATTVQTGGTVTFTATLANDTANGNVTWTATAGTFNPVQTAPGVPTTYTAPTTGGTVIVTATSTTDPTKSATANLSVTAPPITVTIANPPTTIQAGATTMLTATLTNDTQNGGVTWAATSGVSSTPQGAFNPSQTASGIATTYTAPTSVPSNGVVTITATSVTDPTQSASITVTVTSGVANSLLNGKYLFALTGLYPAGNPGVDVQFEGYVGSFTADGNGNITAGDVDFQNPNLNAAPESFTGLTGTYSVQSGGHGTITLTGGSATLGGYSFTMSVTLVTATHGRVMSTMDNSGTLASGDSTGGTLSGTLDKQTASSFTQPLAGNYSFTYGQIYVSSGYEPDNLGGVFTIQNGSLKKTVLDENAYGTVTSSTFTGSDGFGAPDANGRGTITFTHFGSQSGKKFVYYLVDSTHFVFVPTQGNAGGGFGTAYQQPATLPTSISGAYAFIDTGYLNPNLLDGINAGGVFTCDGAGNISGGTLDVNNSGNNPSYTSVPIMGGSCTVDAPADGRAILNIASASSDAVAEFALYATANNGWLMLELDPNADGTGVAYPQAAGISAASFAGTYVADIQSYNLNFSDLTTLVGSVTGNATAPLTGTVDVKATGSDASLGLSLISVALTDTGQGRLTGNINTTGSSTPTDNVNIPQVFYVIDANTALTFETDSNQGTGILELQSLTNPAVTGPQQNQ